MSLKHLLIIFIILFLTFIRCLNFGFVWLDHAQIEEGKCIIKSILELKSAFIKPLINIRGNYYRPLLKISYTLDSLFYNRSPFGFHLTSVLLHILNLFIFYFILIKFNFKSFVSLLLTLIYGVLPLNTSTVVWLGSRADLLVTFFILLSFLFLIFNKITASLLCYALALLSKESAFPFFIVIVIFLIFKENKFNFKIFLPYLALAIAYLMIRTIVVGELGTRMELFWGSPEITILSSTVGFCKYIMKFFLPFNLSVTDAFPKYRSLFNPAVAISLITLLTLLAFLIYSLYKKKFIPAISLAWLFSFYLPISNIIPALHFWQERFFYLPGFGFTILLGYFLTIKKSLKFIPIFLIPIYAIINFNYQSYFQNDIKLFYRTLGVSKFSKEACALLGYTYVIKNNYYKAIYHYYLAIQKEENYYTYSPLLECYNNLGVVFLRLGHYNEAEKYFKLALKEDPQNKNALLNLRLLDSIVHK